MAVVVGQYILTDNNTVINDYAIGLSLPLQMGGNTFNQTYDNLTQLKSNVKNLLLTNRGERLAQPLFGSDLQKILFEPITEETQEKIYNTIEQSISFWLPQLLIQSIDVQATDAMKDSNTINISIVFTARYNQQNFSVNFNVTQ
jgi:phage baseplate assembly protein W